MKTDVKQQSDSGSVASHCSSSAVLVDALRVLARDIQCDDGVANACVAEAANRIEKLVADIKQIHRDYGCEVRDPAGTIWDHAANITQERDNLREQVGKLRALLFEVLENDELAEGFNNANLGDLRQQIRDAVAFKL